MNRALCKVLTCIVCFILILQLGVSAKAEENDVVTLDIQMQDDTAIVTVYMPTTEITSIGVSISYSDGLTLSDAHWLIEGLIANFDEAKDKGVYSPGMNPAAVGGQIFRFTLAMSSSAVGAQSVTVSVLGKYSTSEVLAQSASQFIGNGAAIWGDADGDGFVDAYDASLIKKYSVGAITESELNLLACDVDADGYVDAFDASLIQKLSVGAIETFPVENQA